MSTVLVDWRITGSDDKLADCHVDYRLAEPLDMIRVLEKANRRARGSTCSTFTLAENLWTRKNYIRDLSGRSIILVPDQYTREAERAAFRHLGVSALMDVEVRSPSRLGSRVLAYTGGGRRPYIDKYGRHMLLYRSARRLADRLQVFKGLE